ncbi:hypothetical protein BROUX41_000810 [Berkeleyomyces rouxiae]|uniref:uncharacterized protein n=1 Tax=Berkeleyomyces rouxiae TaxID=2035830 RepID=UPI003B7FCEC5
MIVPIVSTTPQHLVLVGACYMDTILDVPYYPHEDEKLRSTKLLTRRGGNCGNALEVLQQLTPLGPQQQVPRLHLVAPLPESDSSATQAIAASFRGPENEGTPNYVERCDFSYSHARTVAADAESDADADAEAKADADAHRVPLPLPLPLPRALPLLAPVDLSMCLYRGESQTAATSYVLRSAGSGSRTVVNYNELRDMTIDEFGRMAARIGQQSAQWWHFEGRIPDITHECMLLLRRRLQNATNLTISIELEKPGRHGLKEASAAADVLFISKSWAEARGHSSAGDCLLAEVAPGQLGFCTWGAQGACVYQCPLKDCDTDDFEIVRQCCKPVNAVIDTLGAGDTFIAAALFGLGVCTQVQMQTQAEVQSRSQSPRTGAATHSPTASRASSLSSSITLTSQLQNQRQLEQQSRKSLSFSFSGSGSSGGCTATGSSGYDRTVLQAVLDFAVAMATLKVQQEGFAGLVDREARGLVQQLVDCLARAS